MTMVVQPLARQTSSVRWWLRRTAMAAGTVAIALTTLGTAIAPAQADPFRSSNPRTLDPQVEAAFEAMFEDGEYVRAGELLQTASSSEPMTHALQAALAYWESDWETLGAEASQTLEAAEALVGSDPLRGNLYLAVGHFMEGTYTFYTQGTVRGTPIVLSKLRQVFDYMAQAEAVNAQDPELNLIKGYMDLMLAVNLPFSSPDEAIARLRNYGGPSYLVNRGLAIAYRDLDRQNEALTAVNQALEETPNNPDLMYLKAQILRLQGNLQESVRAFRQALNNKDQYPTELTEQIAYEMCRTQNDLRERNRDCSDWADDFAEGRVANADE